MLSAEFDNWLLLAKRPPLVMGVLNVTPDSFSDGGRFTQLEAAVAHARQMVADGADLIDLGGESTRPGANRIPVQAQIDRVVPVIEQVRDFPTTISIDTTRAEVAGAALAAGAHVVNDISGGMDDTAMLPLIATSGVPIILMHMRGQPATMQNLAAYDDVLASVRDHLSGLSATAQRAGIAAHRILLDPGIGFAKKNVHSLELIRRLHELTILGRPLVLGTSRKKFIGTVTGEDQPSQRVYGTAATVAWCVANGADIVRVHDVGPMSKVVKMTRAILGQ